MKLSVERYVVQVARWPERGNHILAHFDHESVVVYQAYSPAIADFAIREGYFGGPEFSYSRMSWIKPNFLWMMYRSGWGTKEGQQRTLAVRLSCAFFESLLVTAVQAAYVQGRYSSRKAWQQAIAASDVRLQWDPDHSPSGAKLERRAIQLGLRGATLERYGRHEPLEILDISAFVAEQREHVQRDVGVLDTPVERVYTPLDPAAGKNVGLAQAKQEPP